MDEEMRKININQASVEELSQIPGIAENLARRIVEYRETVHPFEEVIELTAVPGISERMVREFSPLVTVEPVAAVERNATLAHARLEPRVEPEMAETADESEQFEFITDTDEEEEIVEEDVEPPVTEETESLEFVGVEETETVPAADEADTVELPPFYEPVKVEPAPEPEPEPEPRPAPQPVAQPSQGRVLGQILLGSILGAFVGALLTLAILAALNNGTLSFTQADSRLRSEIQDTQQTQTDLQQTVDTLDTEFNTNLGSVATRTGDLFLQQQETDASLQEMTTTMRQTQMDVTTLEEVTDALDERLTTVAAAAETFDAFLDGLRDLLVDLDGGPADGEEADDVDEVETTSTPAAVIEATPTPTEEAGETATAVPSPTSRPTRTPRPTATLIPLPTSTPGQQP